MFLLRGVSNALKCSEKNNFNKCLAITSSTIIVIFS